MEHKLTEEVRRKMLGLMPFSQGGTIKFTPDIYRNLDVPNECKPIFIQRSFTRGELDEMRGRLVDDRLPLEDIEHYGRLSIKGWSQYYDLATLKLIEFKADPNGNPEKELYSNVPSHIRADIFDNSCKLSGMLGEREIAGLKSLPQST